jgi:biopolymer transport protein ExbB/TolQ
MDLSLTGIWAAMGIPARMVVITMSLMLFWCVYVAAERILYFMAARGQSRALAGAIGAPLKNGDLAGAIKLVGGEAYKKSYLAVILGAGLKEYEARTDKHGIAAAKRALETVSVEEGASLRKGMNVLATTGSTTPFVGLVGTIFGIINAFSKMATAGGGDLTSISGGIAEALVSTAVGISVAIVAIWFYNYFNAVIDEILKDVSVASAELTDFLEKDVLRRSESAAAK